MNVSCSRSYSHSSPVALSEACTGLLQITPPGALGEVDMGCSGFHSPCSYVVLGHPDSRSQGLDGSGQMSGTGVLLDCTHCRFLEPDPGMMGPSRLVRRPDAEVTLASAHCRHLGSCQEVLHHSLLGDGGGFTQVMAGKWHSLDIL